MGTKGRAVPRVVCCAIPIARAAGKVLVVTSRKRPNNWEQAWLQRRRRSSTDAKRWLGAVGCAVGGCSLERGPGRRSYPLSLSPSPHLLILVSLSLFAPPTSHTHLPPVHVIVIHTAGVRGTITRYVITIPTPSATYHFYELDVVGLEQDWLERNERRREWVDYAEACRRLEWKSELAQGLKSSSLAR
ncbi:unnamed protein product [Cyclocybe aegerita]|uniref:Uncharacterized protein n=1 Tax=Cyclocybe aegerita TaxID=1973307 RepID=A0A8S0WB98_CYCAE|nr:unnamed protein product [Cyclocybe aegerita]